MKKVYISFFAILLLVTNSYSADSKINPKHQTCKKQDDCVLIDSGCNLKCHISTGKIAINKEFVGKYKNLEYCTEKDIINSQNAGIQCVDFPELTLPQCDNGLCRTSLVK